MSSNDDSVLPVRSTGEVKEQLSRLSVWVALTVVSWLVIKPGLVRTEAYRSWTSIVDPLFTHMNILEFGMFGV